MTMQHLLAVVHQLFLLLIALTIIPNNNTVQAQHNVIISEITNAQSQYNNNKPHNDLPFLSATLKTELSTVSSYIQPIQLTQLSNSISLFLQHIFNDQDVYDIDILGVTIYEEMLLKYNSNNNRRELIEVSSDKKDQQERRKLPLNRLQSNLRQFQFVRGNQDEYEDISNGGHHHDHSSNNNEVDTEERNIVVGIDLNDEDWQHVNNLIEYEEEKEAQQQKQQKQEYTLSFATVVTAEHTKHQQEDSTTFLSHDDFQDMLVHVCTKFNSHLVDFIKGSDSDEDGYFENVESVLVSGYEQEEEGMVEEQGEVSNKVETKVNTQPKGETCNFCSNGLTTGYEDYIIPIHDGNTQDVSCAMALSFAAELDPDELDIDKEECDRLLLAERYCCPSSDEGETCNFCANGLTTGYEDYIILIHDGSNQDVSCAMALSFAAELDPNELDIDQEECDRLMLAETYCCPSSDDSGGQVAADLNKEDKKEGGYQNEIEALLREDDNWNGGGEAGVSNDDKLEGMEITAIVLSILIIIPLVFATVRLRRKAKQQKLNQWRQREIDTANYQQSSIKSLRVLSAPYNKTSYDEDDYSFDPLGDENIYPPPSLFHDGTPSTNLSSRHPNEEEVVVYAPPGKIGVAIDVIHGHPCVHMVKRGSPVEGLLQPNDKVLSIDDVDTSCMSAADVTHLMVKGMKYQRKITVIRRS